MAEENKTTNTENQNQNTETKVKNSTPTVEELMAQLETAKAEAEEARANASKYKNANDKLSKSEAEMKRQLRAKQTAEEQEAEAQAEAKRLAEEETENLRRENNRYKALSAYKALDEKTVDVLLGAVSDADHVAIAKIIENEKQKAVKEAEASWLKSRPRVNAGQYSSMTREQIMAIADRNERRLAMSQNMDLFR